MVFSTKPGPKNFPLLNNVVISIHRGKIRLSVREAVLNDRVACFTFVTSQHLSSEKNKNKAGRLVNPIELYHNTPNLLLLTTKLTI